jgi:hypothetical protein
MGLGIWHRRGMGILGGCGHGMPYPFVREGGGGFLLGGMLGMLVVDDGDGDGYRIMGP